MQHLVVAVLSPFSTTTFVFIIAPNVMIVPEYIDADELTIALGCN